MTLSASALFMPGGFVPRRSVTSLFSNLVTRPTGRAIRSGVESQLAELDGASAPCLSVLDFAQVRILDYSCADEIVAKLLLRFLGEERPADAYFVVRGLDEHHVEPIEAVLERHDLMLAVVDAEGGAHLLGATNPLHRAVWAVLARGGRHGTAGLAEAAGVAPEAAAAALGDLVAHRVALRHDDGAFTAVSTLLEDG